MFLLFLRFLPPAVGIPFQSTYKPCCSETGCRSSNTEFSTSTVHKSLFRPLFLSPHSPSSRSWVYISEPDNLNLYRRYRHFTCPLFPSRFDAVKPYLPFLRLFSRGGWVCSWSTQVAFSKFSCRQSQHSGSAFSRFFFVNRLRFAST